MALIAALVCILIYVGFRFEWRLAAGVVIALAHDVVITMGCGDACPIFPGKRYEDWDVADPDGQPLDVVRDIRDDIQQRVTRLLRDVLA